MKILLRIIAVLLFIVFFGFAMKNTQEVSLQFFLGYEMRGPLAVSYTHLTLPTSDLV